MTKNGSFKKLTENVEIDPTKHYLLREMTEDAGATHVGVKCGQLALFKWSGATMHLPFFAKSGRKWKYVLIPERADSIALPFYRNRDKDQNQIVEHYYGKMYFLRSGVEIATFSFDERRFSNGAVLNQIGREAVAL